MKTPMQELIEQMSYNRDRALGAEKDAYNICILYATQMLEKEKNLLIAYEKQHYTPSEWILASEQCKKEIDEFLND